LLTSNPNISELTIKLLDDAVRQQGGLSAVSGTVCGAFSKIDSPHKINVVCRYIVLGVDYGMCHVRDGSVFVLSGATFCKSDGPTLDEYWSKEWSTSSIQKWLEGENYKDDNLVEVSVPEEVLADAAEKERLEVWLAKNPQLHTIRLVLSSSGNGKNFAFLNWSPRGVRGKIVLCSSGASLEKCAKLAQAWIMAVAQSDFWKNNPEVGIYIQLFDFDFYVGKGQEFFAKWEKVYSLLGKLVKLIEEEKEEELSRFIRRWVED
jgi:hypothetical protein